MITELLQPASEHVMWCDVDDCPRVGEMRGGPDDAVEQRARTTDICPMCGDALYEITGYAELVIVMELRGKPVNGKQLVVIQDIPREHRLLSCQHCCQNFTAVSA